LTLGRRIWYTESVSEILNEEIPVIYKALKDARRQACKLRSACYVIFGQDKKGYKVVLDGSALSKAVGLGARLVATVDPGGAVAYA
jgi:hypothetical protein